MSDSTVLDGLVGALAGALAAFGFSILYTQLRMPKVRIVRNTTSFVLNDFEIDTVILSGQEGQGTTKTRVTVYRVAVTNSQKLALNAPARNCVAWLELDGATERYQLSWVGGLATVVINVGDQREIDLCAHLVNLGLIIGPTERGYPSYPRLFGRRRDQLKGYLWVTSENAKKDRTRIQIQENKQGDALDISFPDS